MHHDRTKCDVTQLFAFEPVFFDESTDHKREHLGIADIRVVRERLNERNAKPANDRDFVIG